MCEFSKYPANPIALGDFSKNCANGLGTLPFCNSRWRRGWSCDRSASQAATLVKHMKIYSQVDDLLTVAEDDRRHLFYEQMREFFFAMREIQPEEVDDQTLEEILEASDQLMGVIHKIRLKRKHQADKEKAKKRFLV